MKKQTNERYKMTLREWGILWVFFCIISALVIVICIQASLINQQKEELLSENISYFSHPDYTMNIKTIEPEIVGFLCVGNYTTKINDTFIGCILK